MLKPDDLGRELERELSADELATASAKALGVQALVREGQEILLGAELHTVGFVSIDTEHEMLKLVNEAFMGTRAENLREALIDSHGLLVRLGATILADLHYRGVEGVPFREQVALNEAWIRSRRGSERITQNTLINFVLGQANMQELGQCLGKLLTPVALAGLLKLLGMHLPETQPQPTSSSGPVTATAAPLPS